MSGMLPHAMAAVTQKWTFSRLKGSSAVPVGLEEQSQTPARTGRGT
ncbi:MAG: hypothetical protein WA364_11475 [Candidatus Nitrosopolaris sp.]